MPAKSKPKKPTAKSKPKAKPKKPTAKARAKPKKPNQRPLDIEAAVEANDVTRVVQLIKQDGPEAALVLAAQRKRFDVICAIMETNVRKSSELMAEALWHAAYNGNELECCRLLLYGARPVHYDKKTKLTTLGAARAANLTDIAITLERRGGTLTPPGS